MFDEEPDGDLHGECAAEIKRLDGLLTAVQDALDYLHGLTPQQVDALRKDAERWRFLVKHWHSPIDGVPLHQWIEEQAVRLDGVKAALDYAIALNAKPRVCGTDGN